MPTTGDIRQLAGLLEGEGSFSYTSGHSLVIMLTMTDLDVIEQVRDWLGHRELTALGKPGSVTVRHPKRGKTLFQISISGARAAGWMMTLYTFLGQRRRGQIRRALEQWFARPVAWNMRTHCPRGHLYDVRWGTNRCRECNRMRCRAAYQQRKARLLRVV